MPLPHYIAVIGEDHAPGLSKKELRHFPYRVGKMEVGDVGLKTGKDKGKGDTYRRGGDRGKTARLYDANAVYDRPLRFPGQARHEDRDLETTFRLFFGEEPDVVFHPAEDGIVILIYVEDVHVPGIPFGVYHTQERQANGLFPEGNSPYYFR
jgi:hypothetical protein